MKISDLMKMLHRLMNDGMVVSTDIKTPLNGKIEASAVTITGLKLASKEAISDYYDELYVR